MTSPSTFKMPGPLPGLTVAPVAVTAPTVPVPPRAEPLARETVLWGCEPLTSRTPEFTVVGPVSEALSP